MTQWTRMTFSEVLQMLSYTFLPFTAGIFKYTLLIYWTNYNILNTNLWEQSNTETSCSGRLWSLHPWKYSKSNCTQSLLTSFSCPCLSGRAGLDKLQRCIPATNILWFYNLGGIFFIYIFVWAKSTRQKWKYLGSDWWNIFIVLAMELQIQLPS